MIRMTMFIAERMSPDKTLEQLDIHHLFWHFHILNVIFQMSRPLLWCLLAVLALNVRADNSTAVEEACFSEEGPWSCLLEDWATTAPQTQQSSWRRGKCCESLRIE